MRLMRRLPFQLSRFSEFTTYKEDLPLYSNKIVAYLILTGGKITPDRFPIALYFLILRAG